MSESTFAAFRTLQLVAGYLPMFLLGYLVGRIPELKSLLLNQPASAIRITAVVASSYLIWFALIAPNANSAFVAMGTADLRFLAASLCPPAAFVLILRSALRVRSVPALVQRVSAASYTIYLLHLPLVVLINLSLRAVLVNTYVTYITSVICSALISFAFHECVVVRSSILLVVLNGKVIGRPVIHAGTNATPVLHAPADDIDAVQRL